MADAAKPPCSRGEFDDPDRRPLALPAPHTRQRLLFGNLSVVDRADAFKECLIDRMHKFKARATQRWQAGLT